MQIEDCFELGQVTRPHGFRGELAVLLDVDDPNAYGQLDSFFLLLNGNLVPYFVKEMRLQENKAVVKLEDVDTQEAAQSLVGCQIYLPLTQLPALEEDQFYYHEIIGYRVVDEAQGRLGTIANVYEMPHQDLIVMDYQGKEVLIPVTDEIVKKANHRTKEVAVNLPEGLLDIYLNDSAGTEEDKDTDGQAAQ